ncbi:MAG: hypothetical protein RTU92_07965 [Candidatus Thorarchaeota archaeon]
MTEKERRFPRPEPSRLTTIRSLKSETKGLVRILCIVVEAREGAALVQDIYDVIDKAASIRVNVEGMLEVGQKYVLIGSISEKSTDDSTEFILTATLAHNVDSLDIKLFKEVLSMESKVTNT